MLDPYKDLPTFKASLERIKTCFGLDGRSLMPCDNKCGQKISVTTFSVFVKPDHERYEVLFVCAHCLRELYVKYQYANKN